MSEGKTVYSNRINVFSGLRRLGVVDAQGDILPDAPELFIEEMLGIKLAANGHFAGFTEKGEMILKESQTLLRFPMTLDTL